MGPETHILRAVRALASLLILLATLPASAENRVALVMGNGDYSDMARLPNPVNDADLMARTLRELGFDVLKRTNADQKEMKRAIQEFGRRLDAAGSNTVGLFYYAGHGLQVNGVNYLVPLDARIQRESDVEIEGVNADWVLAQMEYAANRTNIVILDACRNNPLTRGFRSATQGLARMDAPRGSLVAYSTAPGSVSVDGTGRNSPYTEALADAMRAPGLAAEEVFRRVRVSVMKATDELQVPWESSSLTGAVYFTPPDETETASAPQPDAIDERGVDLAFWNSIKDSEQPAAFREYLERFPEGEFTRLARLRLEELTSTPPVEERSRSYDVSPVDVVLFTQKHANLRASPSTQARRLATVPPGTELRVTGRVSGGGWYRARYREQTVFVWAPLLAERPPAQERPSGAQSAVSAASIEGRWTGRYRCQEEEIGFQLDVTERSEHQVSALFEFFPLPGTLSFPRGKFEMSGEFDPAEGTLYLESRRWIKQPLGFQSHDIEGRLLDAGSTIKGRILTTGCAEFTLSRR